MKRFNFILCSIALLTLAVPCSAAVIHVSVMGSDQNSGASWSQAKQTIQAAVNASQAGDEIRVAAGEYEENIMLSEPLILRGGFDLNEETPFQMPETHPSVISASSSHPAIAVQAPVILDGFHIQGGSAGVKLANNGQNQLSRLQIDASLAVGVWLQGAFADMDGLTITNTPTGILARGNPSAVHTLTNSTIAATSLTAASFETVSSVLISGCTIASSGDFGLAFKNCESVSVVTSSVRFGLGVAIYARNTGEGEQNLAVADCLVTGNGKGGVVASGVQTLVAGSVIASNGDMGVSVTSADAVLKNNTIAYIAGPAVQVFQGSSLVNNILAHNLKGISGSPASVSANCLFDNKDGNTDAGFTLPSGNLLADPLLADIAMGNLHLKPNSPCIDSGLPVQLPVATDMDGQARVSGSAIDIGADEFHPNDEYHLAAAPVFYVAVGGSGDGSSWSSPLGSMKTGLALAALAGGGEVRTRAGTYQETVQLNAFTRLAGGYPSRNSDTPGRNPVSNKTRIIPPANEANITVAILTSASLDGFVLRFADNNKGQAIQASGGGGKVISSDIAALDIETTWAKVGIFQNGGQLELVNTVFRHFGNFQGLGKPSSKVIFLNCNVIDGGFFWFDAATNYYFLNSIISQRVFSASQDSLNKNRVVYGKYAIYDPLAPATEDGHPIPVYGGAYLDSGDDTVPGIPLTDMTGAPRKVRRVDLGPIENQKTYSGIGEIKQLPLQGWIGGVTGIATVSSGSGLYIQEPDRSSGIVVAGVMYPWLYVGKRVSVDGTIGINSVGELTLFSKQGQILGDQSAEPLFVRGNQMGGGASGVQPALWRHLVNSPEPVQMNGLPNVGLYVTVAGWYRGKQGSYTVLDDLSGCKSAFTGLPGIDIAGIQTPLGPGYYKVNGAVSIRLDASGKPVPIIWAAGPPEKLADPE